MWWFINENCYFDIHCLLETHANNQKHPSGTWTRDNLIPLEKVFVYIYCYINNYGQ